MTAAITSGVQRKLDAFGRVVIPAEIRQAFGLNENDVVGIEVQDGAIVLHPQGDPCPTCGLPRR